MNDLELRIMKEQLNRLAYLIDNHPFLSGMMTREYLGYVEDIASLFNLLPLQTPNFELDLVEDDPFTEWDHREEDSREESG